MLSHMGQEGPRECQTIPQRKTSDGWRCRDGCATPPGMFSADRILWPLIGCRPRMVGSAGQTSHIRKDPGVRQAVVAEPVTGSLVVISWLYIRDTVGTIIFPQKWAYGGTDRMCGTIFRVWLHIGVEGCNMDVATSVLPWDATEAVVDVSVAGVEIQHSLPDAMGLEGRTKYATRSRILRGRDPRSIRVLIPVGQGPDQSVHDVTILDMGKLPEPHVTVLQLAELIHKWPPAVINHMTWRQRENELMRSVAKTELKHNSMKPCTFCGASIKMNMYRHVARCHLQLAQLWRCPVPWCTIWKGTPQDMSPKRSGISNDALLFSEVGLTLVHHYRVHSAGLPHAMFRGKYLAQLRLLLLTGDTTPTPERPLGDASPQVPLVSSKTVDSYARLRPSSERPPGNAGPRVTQMSSTTEDSCTRLRPSSERPPGNAGPRVTQMSSTTEDSYARLKPSSERPPANAGPRVTQMSSTTEDSCARLRPSSERPPGNAHE